MKATIDVPDDLYRRVKAKSALEGRAVREVAVELFQEYVAERTTPAPEDDGGAVDLPAWFAPARRHIRATVADHSLEAIRRSIESGRRGEVAEREGGSARSGTRRR